MPVESAVQNKRTKKESIDKESIIGDFLDRKHKGGYTRTYTEKEGSRNTEESCSTKTKSKLSELLPRYRVHCQKCGETVPCHWFRLEKSKVLCPSCASSMTGADFIQFNRTHKDTPHKTRDVEETNLVNEINPDESDVVAFVGGCSEYFIRRADDLELLDAVKRGKLSKVRYRMEPKRRERPDYYDSCHEDEERSFGEL